MIWPNENPLTPDSLAMSAMDAAQAQLDRYALATHDPEPGVVEAADPLDAAGAVMEGTP